MATENRLHIYKRSYCTCRCGPRYEPLSRAPFAVRGWARLPPHTVYRVHYKGTTVDHVLRLVDGQQVVGTATAREAHAPGETVPVGLDPERIVLLEA